MTAVVGRRFGAWAATTSSIRTFVGSLFLASAVLSAGCAAGNSVETSGGDATLDGLSGESGEADGQKSDTGNHHGDSGGHDATSDADHDAHGDGDVDSGPSCIAPQVKCGATCVSTSEDPKNCGSCGHACATGLVCSSGVCSANCAAGQVRCTTADGGTVTVDAAVPDASKSPVDAGDAASTDGAPVDATTPPSDASPNSSGDYCADPTDDRLNCGACGNICPYGAHSTPVCSASTCSITCDPGYADCDGKASNGCEVETDNNPASCGACGVLCAAVNDTPSCVAGVCGIASCNAGFANCDGNARNGCETNTNTTSNCGGCGNMCNIVNGTAGCPAGACTVQACNSGYGDCDGNPTNGCETNTTSSVPNCGGCGSVCATANASPVCSGSQCRIGGCNPGFQDCDGNAANGCEINTSSNPSDCGGCGHVCSLPSATAGCSAGNCTVAACSPGTADCNGNPTDGCEVDTNTSSTNCGTCGHTCTEANGSASCTGGACTVSGCNAGYADCDGKPANGCEVDVNNDPNNCGGCGHVCVEANGVAGCSAGACRVTSCNAGFADCDGNPANGCETNTTTDTNNCGSCGKSCLTTCGGAAGEVAAATCSASACSVTVCDTGYSDFDRACADGCECKASTTETACANATSLFAGSLEPGQSIAAFSSTMAPPASVSVAYFTLIFGGNTGLTYHPKISITSPGNEFIMDVTAGCAGTLLTTCADNGANESSGVLSWEDSYIGPAPEADPSNASFSPIPLPQGTGQVYIKVYRKAGATPTCNSYTLSASN